MMKRLFALLLATMMLFNAIPVGAIAQTADESAEPSMYFITDSVWVPEGEEPAYPVVETGMWVKTEETSTETKQICEIQPHVHQWNCTTDENGSFTCNGHVHTDDCKAKLYECIEHTHTEACGLENAGEPHQHTQECYGLNCQLPTEVPADSLAAEQCAQQEHTHTDACHALVWSCGLEESLGHQHGAECFVLNCENTDENHEHTQECHDQICQIPEGTDSHSHAQSGCTSAEACTLEEHTHSTDSCLAPAPEVHEHTQECYGLNCQLSTEVPAEVCTLEEHTHTEQCQYTLGELSCGLEEHTHITEGCNADCAAAEHTHGDDCYQETTLVRWEVAVKEDAFTTFDQKIRLFVKQNASSSRGVQNATVTITYPDGTEETVTTSSYINSGNRKSYYAEVTLADGSYEVAVVYNYERYTGTLTISGDGDQDLVLSKMTKDPNYDRATARYDSVSSFDHVDVRVSGTYTDENGTVACKISNVKLTVETKGGIATTQSGQKIENVALTGNTTYEWRTTGLNLDKATTVVTVTCDVTIGSGSSAETITGVTLVYQGREDFIEAIRACDIQQGLDFEIQLEDIQEAIDYYKVQYVWTVHDVNGNVLPESAWPGKFPKPPVVTSEYESGYTHTIDTEYQPGTHFIDYNADGEVYLYTFSGWTDWWDMDTASTPITGTQLTITSQTTIHGFWTVQILPEADGYIYVDKVFLDENGQATQAYPKEAEELWFRVTAPYQLNESGNTVDTDYTDILSEKAANGQGAWIPIYGEGVHTIVEHAADVDGYTRTTRYAIESASFNENNGTYQYLVGGSSISGDSLSFTTNLPVILPDPANDNTSAAAQENALYLGKITCYNTYEKQVMDDKHVFPTFDLLKRNDQDALTPLFLDGAEFTLYYDALCSNPVTYPLAEGETEARTVVKTTGDGGLVRLDFNKIRVDFGEANEVTYYLKETKAPAGYRASGDPIAITIVRDIAGTEELVPVVTGEGENAVTTYVWQKVYHHMLKDINGRLNVYNEEILGSIAFSKTFKVGADNLDITSGYVGLDVHGPVVLDDSGAVTALGELTNVRLEYNDQTGWEEVLSELKLGTYFIHETFPSIHGYTWTGVDYSGLEKVTVAHDNKSIEGVLVTLTDNAAGVSVGLTNHYTEWTDADFYIYKTDFNTRKALSGAEFTLYKDADCIEVHSGPHATGTDGYAHFEGLQLPAKPDGTKEESVTYYLKETKAPDGYYLNETVYEVKLFTSNNAIDISITGGDWSHDDDVLNVKNAPITGNLTITKDIAGDLDETTFLGGGEKTIALHVVGEDGKPISVMLNAENNWTDTVTNLPLGTYEIHEVQEFADQPGYTRVTTVTVNGADQSGDEAKVTLAETAENKGKHDANYHPSATVAFTNTYTKKVAAPVITPTGFSIYKASAGTPSIPLAGAEFQLYTDADCKKLLTGVDFDTKAVSDQNGLARFTGMKLEDLTSYVGKEERSVTYYLKEIKAPTGYVADATVYEVVLTEDFIHVEELNTGKNVFETIIDWVVGVFGSQNPNQDLTSDNILTILNTKDQTNLVVSKKVVYNVEGVDVSEDAAMVDWLKDLVNPENNNNPFVSETYDFDVIVDNQPLTDVDKNALLDRMKDGDSVTIPVSFGSSYVVTENAAGGNYNVTLPANATGTIDAAKLNENIPVEIVNTYNFRKYDEHEDTHENHILRACLEFTKTNKVTNAPVAGAGFTLYESDKTTPVNQGTEAQPVYELVTAADGKLHFHVTEEGTYFLKETKVPEGYKAREGYIEINVTKKYEVVTENGTTTIIKKLVSDLDDAKKSVVNDPIPGKINITKTFSGLAGDDQNKANVVFHVHGPVTIDANNTVTAGMDQVVRVDMDDLQWQDNKLVGSVENLPVGTYLIHEAFASIHGYTFAGTSYNDNVTTVTIPVGQYKDTYVQFKVEGTEGANDTLNLTATNSYTKWTAADFYVRKIDAGKTDRNITAKYGAGGSDSNAAWFQLYENAACQTPVNNAGIEITTTADGRLHFTGLVADETCYTTKEVISGNESDNTAVYKYTKEYYLKETAAPANYTSVDTVWKILVTHEGEAYDLTISGAEGTSEIDGNTDTLTVKNAPYEGKLTIEKIIPDNSALKLASKNATGDNLVQNIFVQVTGPDGYDEIVKLGKQDDGEYQWSTTLNHLRMGTYTVTEVNADRPGYTLETTVTGTENNNTVIFSANGEDKTVSIQNVYTRNEKTQIIKAGLEILKLNEKNQPLSGVEFTLTPWKNGAADGAATTHTTDGDGKILLKDLEGTIDNEQKKANSVSYRLKETKARDGYELPVNDWIVTIDPQQGWKVDAYNEDLNAFETFIHWIANLTGTAADRDEFTYDNGKLVITNKPKKTELKIRKAVEFYIDGKSADADAVKALLGDQYDDLVAESYDFNLTIDGEAKEVAGLNAMKPGAAPVAVEIAYGSTYIVEEVVGSNASYNVRANKTSATENTTVHKEGISGTIGTEQLAGGVVVTITNTYNFKTQDKASVELTKVDGVTNAALAGAKFALYKGKELVAQGADAITTSNANGTLRFYVTEAGQYVLKEEKAPAGYVKSAAEIKINVTSQYAPTNSNGTTVLRETLTVTVENGLTAIENTRKPIDLTVKKVWNDADYYNRPDQIKVELIGTPAENSGKEVVRSVLTLKAKDGWQTTAKNLDPSYTWTVSEGALGQGYEVAAYSAMTVTGENADTVTAEITVTNTRPVKTVEITVKKSWRGTTGAYATMKLYQNGVLVDTVKLTASGGWTYTWRVPDNFKYEVDEVKQPGYYKKVRCDSSGLNWTVTNTTSVIPETGDTILFAVGTMSVSAAALMAILFYSRRRRAR